MGRIRRIIPFSFWPRNWGASGKTRAIEEAQYYYDGEELDLILLDINFEDKESKEYKTELLKIQKKYGKIDEKTYRLGLLENDPALDPKTRDREIALYKFKVGEISQKELDYRILDLDFSNKKSSDYKIQKLDLDLHYREISREEYDYERLLIDYPNTEVKEYKLAKLDLDLKYEKITQIEYDHEVVYINHPDVNSIDHKVAILEVQKNHGEISIHEWEKETATLIGQPWFNIINAEHSLDGQNTQLAIELDWNEHFITFLEAQGWTGATDDEIVDKWFEEAMRQMLKLDTELEAIDDAPYKSPGPRTRRTVSDEGLTEYS